MAAQPQTALASSAFRGRRAFQRCGGVAARQWSQCDSPGTCHPAPRYRWCSTSPSGGRWIFAFGLYVLLVPFDNLLALGAFGTLTRLLGIVAGVFLMIWVIRRRDALPVSRPLAILIALGAWMLASSVWAINQGAALQIMPTYVGLFLLYAVLSCSPFRPPSFGSCSGWSSPARSARRRTASTFSIIDPSYAASDGPARLVMESGSATIDPNHFADVLLFPVAIVIMWALRARRVAAKLAGIAGVGGAGDGDSPERFARRLHRYRC